MTDGQSGHESTRATETAADYDDDRDRQRSRSRRGSPVLGSASLADLHTGMARAMAEGFRAYEQEVHAASHDDVVDLVSRMLDGLIRSSAAFAEEVSRSARRMADRRREDRDRDRTRDRGRRPEHEASPPAIDYERLARLVAKELREPTPPVAVEPQGSSSERGG